jgi:1,4-alpha-glucan branching enzyme
MALSDGINFEKVQGVSPSREEKPDIFLATRLVRLKGIDVLIKAVHIAIESIPELTVHIAGVGPYEDKLKAMVKELNLEDHIKFVGFISDEVKRFQYYKACKIVVAPTRWDLQPYAVVEAAASGKPSIISDAGNAGMVEDAKMGFLFKSEDAEDLAAKIVRLLKDDKLREEMGRRGLEKAKELDWERVAIKAVDISKTVITDFHGQTLMNIYRQGTIWKCMSCLCAIRMSG